MQKLPIFRFDPFCSKGALGSKDKGAGWVVTTGRAGKPGIEILGPYGLANSLFKRVYKDISAI